MQQIIIPAVSIFSLFLFSCKKDQAVITSAPGSADSVAMTDTTAQTDTLLAFTQKYYLALGDSYTIGQSVAEHERYPVQAVALLKIDSINFAAPEIIARTGWTTANLATAIQQTPPSKSNYDIVTLLIGVNNQYQGLSKEQYKTEFTDLLNKAIQFAGGRKRRVIVLSIPDYSVTPFVSSANAATVSAQLDLFNAINKEVTLAAGIQYLDITASTRLAVSDPSLIANDGLHPSGKEYTVWANSLAPLIKAAVQ